MPRPLKRLRRDLDRLDKMIGESADLKRLIRSPVYSSEEQAKALSAVFSRAEISGLVSNIGGLLARNRRLFVLPDVIRGYRALAAAHRGEVTADVVSAEPLSDDQAAALGDALKESTGKGRQTEPEGRSRPDWRPRRQTGQPHDRHFPSHQTQFP